MRLFSKLVTTIAIIATLASAGRTCSTYEYCWCEGKGVVYKGKVRGKGPMDIATKASCTGEDRDVKDYGSGYLECRRYKLVYSYQGVDYFKGSDNCKWNKDCIANGGTAGFCRMKLGRSGGEEGMPIR